MEMMKKIEDGEGTVKKMLEDMREGQEKIANQVRDNLGYKARVIQPFINLIDRTTVETAKELSQLDVVMVDENPSAEVL